mmetsp:Transcript_1364/g.1840  ORF Transcript_1364/g.1840 Transcript_1364/m.1840 type:complete len:209 (-) Transcript_1364:352-978(-)
MRAEIILFQVLCCLFVAQTIAFNIPATLGGRPTLSKLSTTRNHLSKLKLAAEDSKEDEQESGSKMRSILKEATKERDLIAEQPEPMDFRESSTTKARVRELSPEELQEMKEMEANMMNLRTEIASRVQELKQTGEWEDSTIVDPNAGKTEWQLYQEDLKDIQLPSLKSFLQMFVLVSFGYAFFLAFQISMDSAIQSLMDYLQNLGAEA